jgi:hypothetical protein
MYHAPIAKAGPGSIALPRSRAPVAKADALLYAHFERPDLEKAREYLTDFGLVVASRGENELFLRGAGPTPFIYRITRGENPRFLGLGLSVPTVVDLEALASALGASVESFDGPGGGSVVRLRDPDGSLVNVHWGLAPAKAESVREAIA